jgi:hypothetical protein
MNMLAPFAAALLVTSAGAALAQTDPAAQKGPEALRTQPASPDSRAEGADTETIEVANPFTADPARPRLVREISEHSELAFGPYNRPAFAQAPIPDFVPGNKGAVGLAFSMKLGGR